ERRPHGVRVADALVVHLRAAAAQRAEDERGVRFGVLDEEHAHARSIVASRGRPGHREKPRDSRGKFSKPEVTLREVIELSDVRKRYGPIEALRGLGGTIDGERVGLLGPNGAGKSPLSKLLLGLPPFEGEALVLGRSARRDSFAIRDHVGYMPETESHLAAMTAVELCVYAGELAGLPRAAALKRAHAALYHVGLEDKRYLKVETYSTGLKQRV